MHCKAAASSEQVQLLQPVGSGVTVNNGEGKKLLVYFPGSDGTGNAIAPQLPGLLAAGFDVRSLYISTEDRSNWEELTSQAISLIRSLTSSQPGQRKVTLVAESFGGCLALRCALLAPELFESMVLVNPATCFGQGFGGLLNLIAETRLLSIFPEQLYQVAQAVLVPLLVDKNNVGPVGLEAVKSMMIMSPPENRRVAEIASSSGPSAASRQSPLAALESYAPAATASWRLSLLNQVNLADKTIATIRTPTLLISSAKDRLLQSLKEGARLERLMPNAHRVVLPKSGHTALLEADVDLSQIMQWAGFTPQSPAKSPSIVPAQRTRLSAAAVGANGSSFHASSSASPIDPAGQADQVWGSIARRQDATPANGARRSVTLAAAAVSEQASVAQQATGGPLAAAKNTEAALATVVREQADEPRQAALREGTNGAALSSSNGAVALRNGNGAAVAVYGGVSLGEESVQSLGANDPAAANGAAGSAAVEMQTKRAFSQRRKVRWSRPDPRFDQASQVLAPLRELISPVIRGAENLPSCSDTDRPILFVGNHTRIGLFDMPFLMIELYLRGLKVRGLAHPAHWRGPLGSFFESFGAVKASPLAAYKLLKAGEAVLLFPGGGREVNKRRGEEYQLFWSESPDFVRLAAKLNAVIIPFAAVGGDDAFDLALDSDELLATPILGDLIRSAFKRVDPGLDIEESVPPITKLPLLGLPSLLPVPNLTRLYFRFMPPIDPAQAEGILNNPTVTQSVYKEAKDQVLAGIAMLKEEREGDPKRALTSRLLDTFLRVVPAFDLVLK